MSNCKFQPISHSWVAINPNAKGIIQFIGGAFFGSFPTFFYKFFFEELFDAGYTIIALPFRFTFNHWSVAFSLQEEQYTIRQEIVKRAKDLGYNYEVYLDDENFSWMGHSLGCKYIALLEFLSDDWEQVQLAIKNCLSQKHQQQTFEVINNRSRILDLKIEQTKNLIEIYTGKKHKINIIGRFIKGQVSLLIAPDISNTRSAIPIGWLANLLDKIGLGVNPTVEQTKCLVEGSNLFNLIGLISFKRDTIARPTCDWIIQHLKPKAEELNGKHLEPIGIKVGEFIVDLNPFDKFIEPISDRKLEPTAIGLLKKLSSKKTQSPHKPLMQKTGSS